MRLNSLHNKWIVRFLVLTQLLLLTSTANAFFWCSSAKNDIHLETNPSGNCWSACPTQTGMAQSDLWALKTQGAFSAAADDCMDTPVYLSSIAPSNSHNLKKSKDPSKAVGRPESFLALANPARVEGLKNPSSSPHLPDRQALSALRTVVLLH